MDTKTKSIADIEGPWTDPAWESGLIHRLKEAWNKPITELSNEEIATLLRQNIAIPHLIPIAEARLKEGYDDGTEIYAGELENAVNIRRTI